MSKFIRFKVSNWVEGVIAAFMILSSSMSIAQSLKPGPQPRTFVSDIDKTEQPYNLFVPTAAADGKPVPLVIALHGHGATWESWFKGTKVCEWAEKEGYAVLCPHGRGNYFYLSIGETDVWEALADVTKILPIDEDRIYLIGHSMGGWGTWNLAASKPDVFAAIVPMSSWAPLDLLGNVEYLNPLFIHGDNDPAVDVQRSRDADAELTKLGIAHKYIELPGVGHESSMISDMLPTIGDWIRDKRRKKEPAKITINTYTYRRARMWWLGASGFSGPGQIIHFDATVGPGTIMLHEDKEGLKPDSIRFFPGEVYIDLANSIFDSQRQAKIDVDVFGGDYSGTVFGTSDLIAKKMETIVTAHYTLPSPPFSWPSTPLSPVIAKAVTPADHVTDAIAAMILADAKVDAVLMSPSMFLPTSPTGDINYDDMFDYVARLGGVTRENEGSGVFKITGATLKEKLADQKDWKPTWWENVKFYPEGEIDDAKEYTVLVPPPLLPTFKKFFGKADPIDAKIRDLRQIIMEAVVRKKEL
ncbi:MAG: alpha/beta fold hydrolase [Candidatus Sumerlaeota bacterium]